MRGVRVIDDLETLRAMAEPTRAALLELLAEPRSATELAEALGVPRTRLYHHVRILVEKGLVQEVGQRRSRALTERVYALTAKRFRASARLLRGGDIDDRVAAVTALVLETTRADLGRSLRAALESGDDHQVGAGRSVAFLSEEEAARFLAAVEKLVAEFDAAHAERADARPYALIWALYPSSHTIV